MKLADAKRIHDALLDDKPEQVEHDTASCEFCVSEVPTTDSAAESVAVDEVRKEDTRMDPIYNQEQADALVAAAVSKAEQAAADKLAEATASLTTELETVKAEVASLQEARDADQLTLAAKDEEIAKLAGEVASRDEEVAKIARTEERLAKVAEVASFTDEYVAANTERWVSMDDESFASLLTAYADMASQVKTPETKVEETKVPEETAMSNERKDLPKTSARTSLFNTLKGGAK